MRVENNTENSNTVFQILPHYWISVVSYKRILGKNSCISTWHKTYKVLLKYVIKKGNLRERVVDWFFLHVTLEIEIEYIYYARGIFRNKAIFKVCSCYIILRFDRSIDHPVNQIYLLSFKCVHLHVTANTSHYQDSSNTCEMMDPFLTYVSCPLGCGVDLPTS